MNRQARLILTLLIFLAIVFGGYYLVKRTEIFGSRGIIKDSGENISDYSAVFLMNGQVYFGKIHGKNKMEVDLRDIYYLQVNEQQDLQSGDKATGDAAQPDVSLVKLGNELHGPNDRMRINREQVLFIESLKDDSKVVKAIDDYKKAQ